jgi:hypothetical protein
MILRRYGIVCVAAIVIFSGCATSKKFQQDMSELRTQMGTLENKIEILSQRQQQVEISSSEQRENMGYLKGRVSGIKPSEYPIKIYTGPAGNEGREYKPPAGKLSTREIQVALKNAGFDSGTVDGKMGRRTRNAIKEFQKAHGLKADGIVGKKTAAQLTRYIL